MKRKNIILASIFGLLMLAQMAIPGQMVYNTIMAEKEGNEYRFKIAPYDPVDFLKGRYLRLNVQPGEAKCSQDYYAGGGKSYAVLAKDPNGYATVEYVTNDKPRKGDYIVVNPRCCWAQKKINIHYPFSRYYMNEYKAQAAEKWLQKNEQGKNVYLVVRVRNGYVAVTGLYVDDKTIEELIE